jgi:esterase/lipase superfamily enzyme
MLRHAAALAVLGSVTFFGTAAGAQPPSDFTACEAAAQKVKLEPIHFATDRPRLDEDGMPMVFDGDRPAFHGLVGFDGAASATNHVVTFGILKNEHDDGPVGYGQPIKDPSLPKQAARQAPARETYASFAQRVVNAAAQPDADLVVYVHGYNTTFKGAAEAALTLRLGLSCATNFKRKIVVLFFAWPSAAKLLKPADDEVRAEWAYRDFKDVMDELYKQLPPAAPGVAAKPPFAVAHSMGNRFLLHEIDRCDGQCFSRVAFVAPDVDSRYFADVLFLHKTAIERATVYVSARDKVLWASHAFHGEGRAGEGGNELLRFNPERDVDTVDAGYVQAGTFCHSYIDRPVVLFDIAKSFFGSDVADPPTRFAVQRPDGGIGNYFEIVENEKSRVKAACVGAPLRSQRY